MRRWNAGDCTFAADAALGADSAPVVWSAAADPDVLEVIAVPSTRDTPGTIDLAAFGGRLAIAAGATTEHVVIRCPGWLRLDIVAGTVREGPVQLAYRLTDLDTLAVQRTALERLAMICEHGAAAVWHPPRDPHFDRLVLGLRVLDARTAGASLRDIAAGLRRTTPSELDWPGDGESTKSWVRRLVQLSRTLAGAAPDAVIKGRIWLPPPLRP